MDSTTLILGDIEELSQQANILRQLRQPPQPTQQEQEEHRSTHMPYRSWPICVKAKGQPTHHRKGAHKEQSLIQLDYAYIMSNNPSDKKAHAILTGVETTTGLCLAVPTSKKSTTRHQLAQLKKFVTENRSCRLTLSQRFTTCKTSSTRTGTIFDHQTIMSMFLTNHFLGCYNTRASQSPGTWCIQTGSPVTNDEGASSTMQKSAISVRSFWLTSSTSQTVTVNKLPIGNNEQTVEGWGRQPTVDPGEHIIATKNNLNGTISHTRSMTRMMTDRQWDRKVFEDIKIPQMDTTMNKGAHWQSNH
eukprot:6491326-Amphidinium_carterae.6